MARNGKNKALSDYNTAIELAVVREVKVSVNINKDTRRQTRGIQVRTVSRLKYNKMCDIPG